MHGSYVHGPRVRALGSLLCRLLPRDASVLDVGCGDALLAHRIMETRPDVRIRGIDLLVRPRTHIPVVPFDGSRFPQADNSVDVVMFIDVLHHTDDPLVLLREATRVAKRHVVIKDHLRHGWPSAATLRFMDWVGNAHHGVRLPYNYWPAGRWRSAFEELQLTVGTWDTDLRIYPPIARWIFDRSLHFLARLDKRVPAT